MADDDDFDWDEDLAYCEHHVEGPCRICMPELFSDCPDYFAPWRTPYTLSGLWFHIDARGKRHYY